MKHKIKIIVNDEERTLWVESHWTLLEVIRTKLGLTGTKKGCGEGECGACSVIMEGKIVNSCLVLAVQANGKRITTIEGMKIGEDLHPLQKSFIIHGAIQCGYCTSGMILASKALIDNNPNPSLEEIKKSIEGNICRCTGYIKIVEAIMAATKKCLDFDAI